MAVFSIKFQHEVITLQIPFVFPQATTVLEGKPEPATPPPAQLPSPRSLVYKYCFYINHFETNKKFKFLKLTTHCQSVTKHVMKL